MQQVLAITLLGVASCATAPRPAPPRLDPALATLAFYVGTWRCAGTTFATDEQWQTLAIVEPALDGTWLAIRMVGPGDHRTIEHKGYDRTTRRWVHFAITSGGGWATLSSPGWEGARMVFEDPGDRATRGIFTKLDDRHYRFLVEENGVRQWQKLCAK